MKPLPPFFLLSCTRLNHSLFCPPLRLPKTSFKNSNIIRQPLIYPSPLHSPVRRRRAFIPRKKRGVSVRLPLPPFFQTKPNTNHATPTKTSNCKKQADRNPTIKKKSKLITQFFQIINAALFCAAEIPKLKKSLSLPALHSGQGRGKRGLILTPPFAPTFSPNRNHHHKTAQKTPAPRPPHTVTKNRNVKHRGNKSRIKTGKHNFSNKNTPHYSVKPRQTERTLCIVGGLKHIRAFCYITSRNNNKNRESPLRVVRFLLLLQIHRSY